MADEQSVLSSGIPGLDVVLAGGFASGQIFVVRGEPGAGKTTFALQFLLEGIRHGERCLYIAVGEAVKGMRIVADSFGWDLDERYLSVHDIRITKEAMIAPKSRAFHPAEVDLGETLKEILDVLEQVQPKRVVIDSITELRLVCNDEIEYRRMFFALQDALSDTTPTVLITDYGGETSTELHLETLAHGSILLETSAKEFGKERRRLRVIKYRGREVRSGWHDFTINTTSGISVFPSVISREHEMRCFDQIAFSGNDSLDKMMGEGIDCGSVTAIIGPSGVGKSTIATQFVTAAAARDRKSGVYIFDETEESYQDRAEALGFKMKEHVRDGKILLRQLDVAELSPGEFGRTLIDQVDAGVSMVVIDSISGYVNALREENLLLLQLHELLMVLKKTGVTTFLTVTQHGMISPALEHNIDVSFLADNIFLLRYFEFHGEVRRAISALKKRRGSHERSIRELIFTKTGLEFSDPLQEMQGILTGEPYIEQQ